MKIVSRFNEKYNWYLAALAVLVFSGNCFAEIYGYIPNSADNTVSIVNTADSTDTEVVALLGEVPVGITTAPAGDFIYVTNRSSNTVSQINSLTGNVLPYKVGTGPVGIAISYEGTFVYVANQDGQLSIINTTDNNIESVQIGTSLFGIAVDFETGSIYVTDDTDNLVYVIDQSDLSVSDSFTVGESPKGIAVDQTDKYIVVVNSGDDTVSIINIDSGSVQDPIAVGSSPFGVAISNDDNYAYVTNTSDDSVSKINLDDFSVTSIDLAPDIETTDSPQGLSVSPFGEALYVVNNNAGTVKVITIADDTLNDTVFLVGNAPVGLGKIFFSKAPSNLTATLANDTEIDLSWTDNTSSETGFTIERRKYTTGIFSVIATVEADVTTYNDMNLDYYSNYYYRIRAENDVGSTLYSNIDFAQTSKAEKDEADGLGCFIATAAYGSNLEPHVKTLRQFRDAYLLTNTLGTRFVEAYYKYSPPIADYVAEYDGLRTVVRTGLAPLVGFSWVAMNYGVMTALVILFSLIILIIGGTCLVVNKRKVS